MRYIGCKRKLLPFIRDFVNQKTQVLISAHQTPEKQIFCDLFAGTATVGQYFKALGFQIISTDLLYSSYIQQYVKVALNQMPAFEKVLRYLNLSCSQNCTDNAKTVMEYLNQLPGMEGFIFQHYAPGGNDQRMYFTDDNAKRIDAIRETIEVWKNKAIINRAEFYILLYALLDTAANHANVTGMFCAYLKHWGKPTTIKPITLTIPEIASSPYDHQVYNIESNQLLSQLKHVDILYLDPPYVPAQYGAAYHLLETIAKWDKPNIKGISGLRDYSDQKSLFSSQRYAYSALEQIIQQNNFNHLFLSYSDEGILSHEQLTDLLQCYGHWDMAEIAYRRYTSVRQNPNKPKRKQVQERLYYLKPFAANASISLPNYYQSDNYRHTALIRPHIPEISTRSQLN